MARIDRSIKSVVSSRSVGLMAARASSVRMVKWPSTKPKLEVNQTKIEARTMTVPARLMKDQPLSQVPRRILTALGA